MTKRDDKKAEALQKRLDELWSRYDRARRAGFFDACWRIIGQYREALLALDAHKAGRVMVKLPDPRGRR